MKRLCFTGAVALAAALLAGCAHDVHATFPGSGAAVPTGGVVVRLTDASYNVTVVVNGQLVADRRHTGRVVVDCVPAGRAVVEVSLGGARETRHDIKREIWVEPGRRTTVPVAGPEMTTAQGVYAGLSTLGIWLVYAALLL